MVVTNQSWAVNYYNVYTITSWHSYPRDEHILKHWSDDGCTCSYQEKGACYTRLLTGWGPPLTPPQMNEAMLLQHGCQTGLVSGLTRPLLAETWNYIFEDMPTFLRDKFSCHFEVYTTLKNNTLWVNSSLIWDNIESDYSNSDHAWSCESGYISITQSTRWCYQHRHSVMAHDTHLSMQMEKVPQYGKWTSAVFQRTTMWFTTLY
jgi:hypothetical protein